MPSRRRAFRIVLAVCVPGLASLVACSPPRAGLLEAPPDIVAAGSGRSQDPTRVAIGCALGQS